jgi:glycosyltransferase involved in cell wall biosynthesis
MKILHVITTIDIGGAEKQLLELSIAQKSSGNHVYILYLKEVPRLRQRFVDAEIVVIDSVAELSVFKQPRALRKMIHNLKPDVLHFHLSRSEIVGALASFPRRYFITRHNTEKFIPNGPTLLSKMISKLITSRALAIIAISEAVKKFLLDSSEVSNKAEIITIPYGISSINIRKIDDKRISDQFIFGTLSRLTAQKDLTCLLMGFANHLKLYPNDQLKIAGVGELERDLKNLALDLGISQRIEWLGKLEESDKFLVSLDTFVLTSKYEGFGLVILECLRSNVPLLCSKSKAALEILGDDFEGFFAVGDSEGLSRLMDDSRELAFRMTLRKQGEKVLPKYTIKRTAAAHATLYRNFHESYS